MSKMSKIDKRRKLQIVIMTLLIFILITIKLNEREFILSGGERLVWQKTWNIQDMEWYNQCILILSFTSYILVGWVQRRYKYLILIIQVWCIQICEEINIDYLRDLEELRTVEKEFIELCLKYILVICLMCLRYGLLLCWQLGMGLMLLLLLESQELYKR